MPDNIIEQLGGEDYTQKQKKDGGKSHADLFWDRKGNIYTLPRKGKAPQYVTTIPRDS